MLLNGKRLPQRGDLAVAAFRPELAQTRTSWWSEILSPGPSDRERAEAAVRLLYARRRHSRPTPRIIWCESPFALVRTAAQVGGGEDIAGEVVYRPHRREL